MTQHNAKNLLKDLGLWDTNKLADFAGVRPEIASCWITGTEDLPAYVINTLTELYTWNIREINEYTTDIEKYLKKLFQAQQKIQLEDISSEEIEQIEQNVKKLLKKLDKLNRQTMNAKRTFAR